MASSLVADAPYRRAAWKAQMQAHWQQAEGHNGCVAVLISASRCPHALWQACNDALQQRSIRVPGRPGDASRPGVPVILHSMRCRLHRTVMADSALGIRSHTHVLRLCVYCLASLPNRPLVKEVKEGRASLCGRCCRAARPSLPPARPGSALPSPPPLQARPPAAALTCPNRPHLQQKRIPHVSTRRTSAYSLVPTLTSPLSALPSPSCPRSCPCPRARIVLCCAARAWADPPAVRSLPAHPIHFTAMSSTRADSVYMAKVSPFPCYAVFPLRPW